MGIGGWRQMEKNIHKNHFYLLSAVLLSFVLFWTVCTPAAAASGEMANLVIFVKMQGADGNIFDQITDHSTYQTDNWKTIKGMYDTGTSPGIDNSFSNYIKTVTCGKVTVKNVFPQIYTRGDGSEGIHVLELSQTVYATDDSMVTEVIERIQASAKENNPDHLYTEENLDLNGDGFVDNLTIVVQGDTINGEDHSFKANYSGDGKINGLYVNCYNAMPSKGLLGASGTRLISHEFLHTLGLPDLYRQNSGNNTPGAGPVGIWDVMAAASSTTPQYTLGHLRAEKGWLDDSLVAEVSSGGTYTLTAVSQPESAGGTRLIRIKTPLPQAESEMLCLEYRRSMPIGQYEHFVDQGLLMYRVDDKVRDHTNFYGENYIYVYRPGVSAPNDAEVSTVNAVLNGSSGETSYGSTDLAASFSENTLYYSDGSNSGVSISNLRFSQDGTTITFDLDFAEYSQNWQMMGGTAANDALQDVTLYGEPEGGLYLGYVNTSNQVCVLKWNPTAEVWQRLGTPLSSDYRSVPALTVYGGRLYLAYLNGSGLPVYSVWNGSAWESAVSIDSAAYPDSLQFTADAGGLYVAYQRPLPGGQKQLVIRNIDGTVITENRSATDFTNPTVIKQGDLFYVAYAEFPQGSSRIDSYDIVTKSWSTVYDYGTFGNINLLLAQGTKLYGFSASSSSGSAAGFVERNGVAWKGTAVPQIPSCYKVSLVAAGQTIYLTYVDSSAQKAGMLRYSDGGFTPCYDGLNGQAQDFKVAVIGDQVYAATKVNHSVTVRRQKVESVPEVPPSLPPLTLQLTPPAGYTNPDIYIDGIKYTGVKNGDSYVLQLPDKTGKTAVMYFYNERNIPKGMYVWRLSYQNDVCTAVPLPGLQDLLSYHGFSIRVQGYSGLRFKSGIDAETRARLLDSGINGYRLTEYGTLLISGVNLQRYPFIKDGEKVGGGRSYWTENGIVNDRIFETVDGRHRFASVVTKLPERQYASDLAFRSYAVLQSNAGEQLIIYGPPVSRSIYTVAKQVLAAGEFKPGSSGHNYVQGIVNAVESK